MKPLILFLLTLCFQLSYADNYPRNENIDIRRYKFQLGLNDSTDLISGEAAIELLVKKSFTELELDLINQNASGKGMTVLGVELNGRQLKFLHQNNRLKIILDLAPAVGEIVSFIVRYKGVPADGLVISKNKYGDRTFFGDNWPDRARNWLPSIDHPYEKAGVDFIVTAPLHYEVIANGIKLEESYINKNLKRTHWREDADIPTKVMVIGAAKFAIQYVTEIQNISIESWVYPQNRSEGFSDYAPAAEILDFFIRNVGPYSYKKLANVQSKTIYGGMENASNIFYYENSVTGQGKITDLLAHEIAHQWFGNSASEQDWHHVWLSEGFATYFTHIYNESLFGKDQLATRMRSDRKEVIALCKKAPAPIIDPSITNYNNLLTSHVYSRASWVLHMLRNELGDDTFFDVVRDYYKTYQNGNALTSDFRAIAEKKSEKKLDFFFDQWLTRPGLPILKFDWKYNKQKKTLDIHVRQLQKGPHFQFGLDVDILAPNAEVKRRETLTVTKPDQTISISIDFPPEKVETDPDVRLLFEDAN